ncbi:MAG: amidase [Alphaproteobacteria bacterium]|nr:MAG: amidase [Alphaproteobacteria bacterium]
MTADRELISLTACQAVAMLRRREVSPLELLEASLERIAETDGRLNAMPTVCADRARAAAQRIVAAAPETRPWGEDGLGLLAGLPFAVKDLNDVAGVRTTYGSPIFADNVPERSDILVETLEANGGIVVGKTNTPEFGAGANTFNAVFGETVTPWNTALTCGGSSGGSAAALAAGQVWLATGSDLGGSLRTPASFCSVVGLRPTPGRVANGPNELPFNTLSVEGPMARNVDDVALMLDAMAGWHIEDPMSLAAPAESFRAATARRGLPARVALAPDLGGITPLDPEVRDAVRGAARRFADLGVAVEEACPDFSGAAEAFKTLRALGFASMKPLYDEHRDKLKPDVVWNIEHGLSLDAEAIGRAERLRGALYRDVARFFRKYDLLLCAAACVPPFDVKTRWLGALGGETFDNYVEWIRITYAVTLTSCPAISVPCGFTRDGRPIGLQIVGRPRGEAALLSAAAAFEDATGLAAQVPIDPRP